LRRYLKECLKECMKKLKILKVNLAAVTNQYITKRCRIGKPQIAHSNSKGLAARIRQKHYHLITGY